jgi:hypothetical protein
MGFTYRPGHHFIRPYARTLFTLLLCLIGHAGAQNFTFAAFGDAPYVESEEARFINTFAEMNRAPLAFAIHVGDFKSGWSPCTDALFLRRRDEFALLRHPLIYVPGDNEWTDCWRAPGVSGAEGDPLQRLQQLRRLFFAGDYSLGQRRIALERQNTTYPEHARWAHDGVLFATLNVPGGGNNARLPRESAARTAMVVAWVSDTFRTARAQSHSAVVLAMQANPWTFGGNIRKNYSAIMTAIAHETQHFEGEVLLIHGDSHRHRIDEPLINPRTGYPFRNFTRIEVFGSPVVNWVRVQVSRQNGKTAFSVTSGG